MRRTESTEPPDWNPPKLRSPSPQHVPVFLWPTPSFEDQLFYVEKNGDLPKNKTFTYGDVYPDSIKYPDHKLVFVSPQTTDTWSRWFYASDRINEDVYNWNLGQGEELIRTYLVPRALYYARSAAEAAAAVPLVAGEFTHPVVPTADTRFTKYGFADDTVMDAPQELRGIYIIVKRRYAEPVVIEYQWSDTFERHIKVTKSIIPAGSGQPPSLPVAGASSEIQNGNVYHDVLIEQELVVTIPEGEESAYPYALPTLPASYNRKFPSKLESIDLVWAWALADDPASALSYSEDYYFKFKITDPRQGPYQAQALRFITDDPAALLVDYSLLSVPQPITESIANTSWWASATAEGNSTFAAAKEWVIPSTIHEEVTLGLGGLAAPPSLGTYTNTLAATPNVTTFLAQTLVSVDYDTKKVGLGLYEVTILQIDISSLYTA